MAEHVVPHFHNEPGVPVIEIGAREFMCVGATPPHDHPHVFLDMGEGKEIICPYCSTTSTASIRRLIRMRPVRRNAHCRIPLPPDLFRDLWPWRPRVMSSSPVPALAG